MKKLTKALILLLIVFSLASCGTKTAPAKEAVSAQDNANAVVAEDSATAAADTAQTADAASQDTDIAEDHAQTADTSALQDVDIDLTKLSSTMVYSEVYNMLSLPENYIGKTVRMNGRFALYQAIDENGVVSPDQEYYACVIADATACCSQGMEFILGGGKVYPDDYPELNEEIYVSGTFETYEEDGYLYCHLVDAVLE